MFYRENWSDCGYAYTESGQGDSREGVLYFNPGSPTVKKRQKYGSVGILTLTDVIKGEIRYLV